MAQRQKGHIYGLKTKKGVAILQQADGAGQVVAV